MKYKIKNNLTYVSLAQFVHDSSGLTEADLLGAKHRVLGHDELDDYVGRIQSKSKEKTDKYEYPYIHSSNVPIVNSQGRKYDLEKLKAAITTKPTTILKQNEKMQHSDGSTSVFYNVGLPALKGLAVNESTGEFVVVDTCPGAGACKTFCYAMDSSYVMFKNVSLNQSKMLNFLLNDPEGFEEVIASEIAIEKHKNRGSKIVVRWHDAGDFFSPEYLEMAFRVARRHPTVGFYAYTKIAAVATSERPPNFRMNFSSGAQASQEKQINFTKTKHARVVPEKMFGDLIQKVGRKLIRNAEGKMQFIDDAAFDEFKARLASTYHIDNSTILTYGEMMELPERDTPKWNVIVVPGDGDDSANRHDVIGTYLIIH